jgi:L-ribulose-5-phosphate 4-epimerase
MRLEALRSAVLESNLELVRRGLILYTFGNASGIDRDSGLVAIKPSGVPYEALKAADLVLTDLDGTIVEGTLRPSSDLATHLLLYRAFPAIGGVVHTHSEFATAWAQAGREIPAYGTHSCRLLLRPGAGDRGADRRRGGRRLRSEHRPRHRAALRKN